MITSIYHIFFLTNVRCNNLRTVPVYYVFRVLYLLRWILDFIKDLQRLEIKPKLISALNVPEWNRSNNFQEIIKTFSYSPLVMLNHFSEKKTWLFLPCLLFGICHALSCIFLYKQPGRQRK